MAGIGFALRSLHKSDSFAGMLRLYGTAGVISSGPWLLSIMSIMVIGVLSSESVPDPRHTIQFQTSVTYLIALSLILSGPLQLIFTRYIADRLYEKKDHLVLPNLIGALLFITVASGLLAVIAVAFTFTGLSLYYRILMVTGFVTLNDIWILVIMLSGLKAYRLVFYGFAVGYGITTALSLTLGRYGLDGLLLGFVLGQAVMFFFFFLVILRHYPGKPWVAFGFLDRKKIYPAMALVGFVYNFGVWIDKFVFWAHPQTSYQVIGPLRASLLYDIPIFLAYVFIMPGMAVFLVRMETDFSELNETFYDAVRDGAPLGSIEHLKDRMVETVRQGIYEIFKVQGITCVILFLLGRHILRAIGVSLFYLHLFYVDIVAVGAQVVLLGIFNVLFYLDERRAALFLTVVFATTNLIATMASLSLGHAFYGYGFAVAIGLTSLLGLAILSNRLDRLEYATFMLQGSG